MTARTSLILGKTRGHRPRLQVLLHEFCNSLDSGGEWCLFQQPLSYTPESRGLIFAESGEPHSGERAWRVAQNRMHRVEHVAAGF